MAEDNNNNNLPAISEFTKALASLQKTNEQQLAQMEKVVKASEDRAKEIKDRQETERDFNKLLEAAYAENEARNSEDTTVGDALEDMGGYLKGLFGFAQDEARAEKRSIKRADKAAAAAEAKGEIKEQIKGIGPIKSILAFFEGIKKVLAPIVTVIAATSLTTIGLVIGGIVAAFAAISGAWERLKPLLGDEDATIFDKVVAVMVGAVEGVLQIPAKIMDFAKDLLSGAAKFLFGEDNKVSKFLDGFSFSELLTKAADWVQKTLTDMGKFIGNAFTAMVDWAKDFISWDKIKKGWNDIMTDPDGFIGGIGKKLGSAVYDVVEWVKEKFSQAYTWITDTFGESWTKTKQLFTDIGTKIGSVAYDAVQWVKDKLSTAYTTVTDALSAMWTTVTETFTSIGKSIGAVAYDAVEWVKNKAIETKDNLFATIESFFKDPVGTMIDIITAPIDLLIDGVAWVVGKLGFDDLSESLKNFSYADAVKNVIMAPINLLKKGVSWVLSKLGFGEDGEGEGDISDVEAEETGLLSTILNFVTAPVRLIGKAFSHVLGMMGFENLLSEIPSPVEMLKQAGEWIGGLLGKAIDWFKSKLSFFGGDDTPKEPVDFGLSGNEGVQDFEDMGVLKNTGRFDIGKAQIDEDAIQQMSLGQLDQIAAEYPKYKYLQKQISEEKSRRMELSGGADSIDDIFEANQEMRTTQHTGFEKFSDEGLADVGSVTFKDDEQAQYYAQLEREKRESRNLKAAMTAKNVALVESDYANPSAVISGTDQGASLQTQDMVTSQRQLDNTKTKQASGGNTNVTAASTTVSTSNVTNNSYTSAPQPSSQDNTDQLYIFRATGTSR